eukprot:scaffold17722_cov65-Attheya_sp.AAC.1
MRKRVAFPIRADATARSEVDNTHNDDGEQASGTIRRRKRKSSITSPGVWIMATVSVVACLALLVYIYRYTTTVTTSTHPHNRASDAGDISPHSKQGGLLGEHRKLRKRREDEDETSPRSKEEGRDKRRHRKVILIPEDNKVDDVSPISWGAAAQENSPFLLPELKPGDMSPIVWRSDGKKADPYGRLLGLPRQLTQEIRAFCEEA